MPWFPLGALSTAQQAVSCEDWLGYSSLSTAWDKAGAEDGCLKHLHAREYHSPLHGAAPPSPRKLNLPVLHLQHIAPLQASLSAAHEPRSFWLRPLPFLLFSLMFLCQTFPEHEFQWLNKFHQMNLLPFSYFCYY